MDFISKAYQALTDPISRENFEKYGHPDGRQVYNFMFVEMNSSFPILFVYSTKL